MFLPIIVVDVHECLGSLLALLEWRLSRKSGVRSVGFESDIQCGINIETADKAHTLVVSGHALNKGQVASDANWIKSFRLTIEDFMANLDTALNEAGL